MVKKYLDASESETIKNKQFDKLRKANNKLRLEFALLVCNLKAKEQEKVFDLLNLIINNEIEQEKLCFD